MTRLIAVGAVYLDTILNVPHFPSEDTKLRATALTRRRGGNCPNTLQVLRQLLDASPDNKEVELDLCAVLPARNSADTTTIRASLPGIGTELCVHRSNEDAPSSVVIASAATSSRTIVNYNGLAEMTAAEFTSSLRAEHVGDEEVWVHFEGRNTQAGIECIRALRARVERVTVSVEVEKPGREGLAEMAREADVLFFSRTWAYENGYRSAAYCVRDQAKLNPRARLLVCTWGAQGCGVFDRAEPSSVRSLPAYNLAGAKIVDTNGAGDTFTAGMLYAQLRGGPKWPIDMQLSFANEIAGRKIIQDGFDGLADAMKNSREL